MSWFTGLFSSKKEEPIWIDKEANYRKIVEIVKKVKDDDFEKNLKAYYKHALELISGANYVCKEIQEGYAIAEDEFKTGNKITLGITGNRINVLATLHLAITKALEKLHKLALAAIEEQQRTTSPLGQYVETEAENIAQKIGQFKQSEQYACGQTNAYVHAVYGMICQIDREKKGLVELRAEEQRVAAPLIEEDYLASLW